MSQSNPPNDLMTDTQLLPCPFCGSEAWPFKHDSPYTTEHSVRCSEGCCEIGDECEEDAVRQWNTRAAIQAMSVSSSLAALLKEARTGIATAFDLDDPGNISTPPFMESEAADLVLRIEEALSGVSVSSSDVGEVVCRHEPYQGSCVHCDIPFRHGQPFYGEQAMSVSSSDVGELVEALEKIAAGRHPNARHVADCWCHMCAEAPGNLREIARKALSSHTLEKRGDLTCGFCCAEGFTRETLHEHCLASHGDGRGSY